MLAQGFEEIEALTVVDVCVVQISLVIWLVLKSK